MSGHTSMTLKQSQVLIYIIIQFGVKYVLKLLQETFPNFTTQFCVTTDKNEKDKYYILSSSTFFNSFLKAFS